MNEIIAIFKQLGVDSTIFFQFAIFVVFFAIVKVLLFDKLQFVIELRESKTTKLEGEANRKFQDAERLADEYREKMTDAQATSQEKLKSGKADVVNRERAKYEEAQKKIIAEMDSDRKTFEQELSQKKGEILSQADVLAAELVNKLS